MQFEERLSVTKLQYLNSLTMEEYYIISPEKDNGKKIKTKQDREAHFSYFKQFCSSMIKSGGVSTRFYKQNENVGRYYCGMSMQGMQKAARGFLMDGVGTDVDMVNAHPTLFLSLCKKLKFHCPNLEYYVRHRSELLEKYPDAGIKQQFIEILYGSGLKAEIEFLKDWKNECKVLQAALLAHPNYAHYKDLVKEEKKNKVGSACSKIMEEFEKSVVMEVIGYLNTRGINVAILMHDGVLVYGDHYENLQLLRDIEIWVESKFPGLGMLFAYKEHCKVIKMPDNFEFKAATERDVGVDNFQIAAKKFEKTHAKIINRGEYIRETFKNGKVKSFEIITEAKLIAMYRHDNYTTIEKGVVVEHPFITKWIGFTNPNIRAFKDIECYPNVFLCPENVYNSWSAFDMEFVDSYEPDQEGLEFMLNHILILCAK
jgi:hypothetical protein